MASFPPKPLGPTVKLMHPDGTPTRDFHTYLTKMFEEVRRPGQASDFQPTSATLPAAGPIGRTVANLSVKGATLPVVYVLRDNLSNLQVAFSGSLLNTTANPVGTVGTHHLGIRATDAEGRTYQGALVVTLT
jgi:hypothetical protein